MAASEISAQLQEELFAFFLFVCHINVYYCDYSQFGLSPPSIVGAFQMLPTTLSLPSHICSRTFSWTLPRPTAELPSSW